MVEPGAVDLCSVDPGLEVDLLVPSTLRTMTSVWMGLSRLEAEIREGRVQIDAGPAIARAIQSWLNPSVFAPTGRRVA